MPTPGDDGLRWDLQGQLGEELWQCAGTEEFMARWFSKDDLDDLHAEGFVWVVVEAHPEGHDIGRTGHALFNRTKARVLMTQDLDEVGTAAPPRYRESMLVGPWSTLQVTCEGKDVTDQYQAQLLAYASLEDRPRSCKIGDIT